MKIKDSRYDNVTLIQKRSYHFKDFDALFVSNSDRYIQDDYDRILKSHQKKSIDLWAWKNDKTCAQFAILCAELDLDNVRISVTDL